MRRFVAAILVATAASSATAQVVTVRVLGPHAPEALNRYVARNAKPIALSPSGLKALPERTPREVIQRLCGWVPQGYYPAFLDVNKTALLEAHHWPMPDYQKIGDLNGKLVWPACLYLKKTPAKERVLPTDTPRSVYKRLVGGDGTDTAVRNFFGKANENLGSVQAKIRKGETVAAPWSTAAVDLSPKSNLPVDDFRSGMERAAAMKKYTALQVIKTPPQHQGSFVTDADNDGTHQTDTPQCRVRNKTPYDSHAVALAYARTYGRLTDRNMVAPPRVDVAVVDNGFFGVNPTAAPFFAAPFDKSLFPLWSQYASLLVGPALPTDSGVILPSNFIYMKAPPNTVSSHGTHVAGLVLGGTYLTAVDRRTIFNRDGKANWMSLSILNTGKGGAAPIPGALGRLWRNFGPLDFTGTHHRMQIVNFSLMLFDDSDSTSVADVNTLLQNDKTDIFVVAAGNGAQFSISGDKIYPAADGGQKADNVITVAALDWDYAYSAFTIRDSNYIDIAAPGCGITSWMDNRNRSKPLSGTSQAAPLVSFSAALLSSLDGSLDPGDIKRRLIISGDPIVLRPNDISTWSGVRLDIPAALYLFDDYVRFDRGDKTGEHEYLGTLTDAKNVFCDGANIYAEDIWSYHNDGARRLLFRGRNIAHSSIARPCQDSLAANGQGKLFFAPTSEIKNGKIQPDTKPLAPLPLTAVRSLVRALPK